MRDRDAVSGEINDDGVFRLRGFQFRERSDDVGFGGLLVEDRDQLSHKRLAELHRLGARLTAHRGDGVRKAAAEDPPVKEGGVRNVECVLQRGAHGGI